LIQDGVDCSKEEIRYNFDASFEIDLGATTELGHDVVLMAMLSEWVRRVDSNAQMSSLGRRDRLSVDVMCFCVLSCRCLLSVDQLMAAVVDPRACCCCDDVTAVRQKK
jgi:hypothetical protein